MSDDPETPPPEEQIPADATPPNPGLAPKPGGASDEDGYGGKQRKPVSGT